MKILCNINNNITKIYLNMKHHEKYKSKLIPKKKTLAVSSCVKRLACSLEITASKQTVDEVI